MVPSLEVTLTDSFAKRPRVIASLDSPLSIPIRDVDVRCSVTKVVFVNNWTMKLTQPWVTMLSYQSERLSSRNQFIAECQQFVRLFLNNQFDGRVIWGETFDKDAPPYTFRINFDPATGRMTGGEGGEADRDLAIRHVGDYHEYRTVGADAVMTMTYRVPLWLGGWQRTQKVHLIGIEREQNFEWRIAPNDEPPLKDGTGVVFDYKGNQYVMKGGDIVYE